MTKEREAETQRKYDARPYTDLFDEPLDEVLPFILRGFGWDTGYIAETVGRIEKRLDAIEAQLATRPKRRRASGQSPRRRSRAARTDDRPLRWLGMVVAQPVCCAVVSPAGNRATK